MDQVPGSSHTSPFTAHCSLGDCHLHPLVQGGPRDSARGQTAGGAQCVRVHRACLLHRKRGREGTRVWRVSLGWGLAGEAFPTKMPRDMPTNAPACMYSRGGAPAHPPHTEVGLRATPPRGGKGNRQAAGPSQPQSEPEPPTGAGRLQRQRAFEAPDPAGGGELRLLELFWDLQTQILSPHQPRQAGPWEGRRVLQARIQPPLPCAHTAHATARTNTHIRCSRCHTHTHNGAHTPWCLTHAPSFNSLFLTHTT